MELTSGWTGRTACALQAALRLSNESFAAQLGVGVRTVASWHQKPVLRPQSEMQQILDTKLEQASAAAKARFAALVSDQSPAPGTDTGSEHDYGGIHGSVNGLIVATNLPDIGQLRIFGRQDEQQKLLNYLRPYPHSQYPTVTLDGIGGVGKSALALSVANMFTRPDEFGIVEQDRFNAVIWTSAKRQLLTPSGIEVQRPSLRNIKDVIVAIAHTLSKPDILAAVPDEQLEMARLGLTSSRVLLIFDNLETVDDTEVMSFIRDLPAPTKAIITTRHRIDGAITIRLTGLSELSSRNLSKHLLSGADVGEIDDEVHRAIARAADGLPLAIAWITGQISFGRSTNAAVRSLKSAKGDFAAFCFRDSFDLLRAQGKENAIRLLMGLSYFVDGATRASLSEIVGLDGVPDERNRALADLLKLSLVNHSDGRFSLLPLTRSFVLAELARDLEFREESERRWIDWAVNLARTSSGGGADLSQAIVEAIQAEYQNIMWATDYAFRLKDMQRWTKILRGLEFFWLGTGQWQDFQESLGIARNAALDPLDRIHFTLRLAWLDVLRDDLDAAEENLKSAAILLKANPSEYEQMRYLDFAGQLRLARGQYSLAIQFFEQSYKIAETLGDGRGKFACAKYTGEAYVLSGDGEEALNWLTTAEKELEEIGGRWLRGIAHILHLRGLCELQRGNNSEAIAALRAAIENLSYWPDLRLLSRVRSCLADALVESGRIIDARRILEENRLTLERLGIRREVERLDAKINELRMSQ